MNANIHHFMPKPHANVEVQLFDFIRHCRERLTVFGADLDWESHEWPGVGRFNKLRLRKAKAIPADGVLDSRFLDFAKAYFRYQQGMNPTKTKNELKALKLLEAVISKEPGTQLVANIDSKALDQAAQLARDHYSPMAAYHAGRELQRVAEFATEKRFVHATLSSWKNPISKPRDDRIQVGPDARKRHQEKLPSEECLTALAEIFATDPSSPRDIFTSAAWAMLLCAPSRATEVLLLPVDLEVTEKDSGGKLRYGWRFYSGKGFEGDIKWIPAVMEDVAREAVRRIKLLTEPGRALARWMEEHPTEFYRHPDCPDVDLDVPLSSADAARALGTVKMSGWKLSSGQGAHTLGSLWEWCMSQRPKGFPLACEERQLKFSDALFCMRKNELHGVKSVSPVRLWSPDINDLNNDLSTRTHVRNHRSIFDRYHYTSADGAALGLTSHSARHLLNTVADRGGLSAELIAKWSGRADPKQGRVYNHIDEFEMVVRTEAVNPGLTCFGPDGEVARNQPVSPSDFSAEDRGAFHWTEYGVCVHDYTMNPCERFRDCIGCTEHVCIKGDQVREQLIRAVLRETENDLLSAAGAVELGLAGADRWFESHRRRVSELRELIGLLDDPQVPAGSHLRLGAGGSFSHLGRIVAGAISSDRAEIGGPRPALGRSDGDEAAHG